MNDATNLDTTSDNSRTTVDPDSLLDKFAAELTRAAYHVALRHGAAATWLDLELDLWCALADAINRWGQGKSLPVQLPLGSTHLPIEVIP